MASFLLATSLVPPSPRAACRPQFQREIDTIPLIDAYGPVPNAWLGGWEKPRPQLLDVDADGDLDLFANEEDGRLRFYRNDGGPAAPSFVFVTDDYAGLHELFFSRFVDVDTDGDFDLLVEAEDASGKSVGILYTNTGTPSQPVYENLSPHPDGFFVDDAGEVIPFVTTTPDFVDLEGDGDPDLLFGDPSGRVYLYRNVGGPSNPVFHFETSSYRDLVIVFGSCNPERENHSRARLRTANPRHGFMLFSFFDIDGDSDPDMFVGDQYNPNVYFWMNVGGGLSPDFSCQTQTYFPDSLGIPGAFSQMLLVTFGDLDGDADPDALMGSGARAEDDGIYFFRNEGSGGSPDFVLKSRDWLPEFDLGGNSAPVFADLDGNSTLDLYLGVGSAERIGFYQNVGTEQAPVFVVMDPAWVSLPTVNWLAPEFADIDADGDLDLFVGVPGGAVRFWRNETIPPGPLVFTEVQDEDFGEQEGATFRSNVDGQPVPRFFDGDGDGDLDVIVGSWDFSDEARLLYFRNDGSPAAYHFAFASSDYQGLGSLGQRLAPALGDLDGDGRVDLLVGARSGRIIYFHNEGEPGAPLFRRVSGALGGIDVGAGAVPALADLDADGDLDLVVGETGGGLNFFRNVTMVLPAPSSFELLSPAPGAAVDASLPVTFDWEPSFTPGGGEAAYEFRLARSPVAPPEEWWVWPGLTTSEFTLVLREEGLGDLRQFYWTVEASNECRAAPVPPWRREVATNLESPEMLRESFPFGITNVFPSPFREQVTISYSLPVAAPVQIRVFDAAGREVAVLYDGAQRAGGHRVVWDGSTGEGGRAAAGLYVVQVRWGERAASRRVVLLR